MKLFWLMHADQPDLLLYPTDAPIPNRLTDLDANTRYGIYFFRPHRQLLQHSLPIKHSLVLSHLPITDLVIHDKSVTIERKLHF